VHLDDGRIERDAESLDVMTDAEFELFYEMSMLVLQQITGVDPETLWKNSPYAGSIEQDEIPMSAGAIPSHHAEQDGGSVSPQAEPPPAAAPAHPPPETEREQRRLMVECATKFFAAATDPTVPDPADRQKTLKSAVASWKGKLPDSFVKTVLDRCNDVVLGRMSSADAKRIVKALIP
jgi:hypothetical protein